jgi:hypothetical protein
MKDSKLFDKTTITDINFLPPEIKEYIVPFIPPEHWKILSKVNKEWSSLVISCASNALDRAKDLPPTVSNC